jgi:hypothetical protein
MRHMPIRIHGIAMKALWIAMQSSSRGEEDFLVARPPPQQSEGVREID